MKTIVKSVLLPCGALLMSELSFSQVTSDYSLTQSKKSVTMETVKTQTEKEESGQQICMVDKFFIPENAIKEFTKQMNYNRDFIKKIPGFIKGEVYEQKDANGNLTIITVAVWQSQKDLDNAKDAVRAEFKRMEFNPAEFYQRLNIKMERGLYTIRQEPKNDKQTLKTTLQ